MLGKPSLSPVPEPPNLCGSQNLDQQKGHQDTRGAERVVKVNSFKVQRTSKDLLQREACSNGELERQSEYSERTAPASKVTQVILLCMIMRSQLLRPEKLRTKMNWRKGC